MTQPNPHSGSSKWTGNTNSPTPQQPNWQPPAGQWGQPAPQQPQWSQQPKTSPRGVNKQFWVVLALFAATLVGSFLPVLVFSSTEGFGLLTSQVNWWGKLSLSAPLGSEMFDLMLETEMPDDVNEGRQFLVLSTMLTLAVQAIATIFAFKKKHKTAAIISIVALLYMLLITCAFAYFYYRNVTQFNDIPGAKVALGAGLWIIIAVVGLVISIRLLFKRNKNQQPPQTWGGPQAPQTPQQFQQPQAPQPNQPNNWGQPGYQWGQPGN